MPITIGSRARGKSRRTMPKLHANISILRKLDPGISKRLLNPIAGRGARVGAPRLKAPQGQYADAGTIGEFCLGPIQQGSRGSALGRSQHSRKVDGRAKCLNDLRFAL
jgi:hypothetical protein